jgi:putative transposase
LLSAATLLATPDARDCFVATLDRVRSRHKFLLVGYVVMPEHVHLLLSEASMSTPSTVLRVLKQEVSRSLRKETRKSSPHSRAEPAHFWQRRFYDFNVRSARKLREKLEYMHGNPVKRNLVQHPKEWPWSSWLYYETGQSGLIRIDIVGSGEELGRCL